MATLLKHQRSYVKGRITHFTNILNSKTQLNLAQLQAIQNNILHLETKFHKIQTELEELDPNEVNSSERESFDNGYCDLDAILIGKIEQHKVKFKDIIPGQCRLPEIELPKFDGRYMSWITFKEEFSNLVHENESLDDVDKFRYLVSCIRDGSAYSIIEYLPRTRVNYAVAWQLLVDSFDNDVIVKKNYVRDIYNIKNVRDESPAALQFFIDTFLKYFKALKALKVNVESWDLFLVYHLTLKLDSESRREVELKSKSDALLSIEEFITILKNRCRFLNAMCNNSNSQKHYSRNQSSNRINRVLVTTSLKCPCCFSNDHAIYKCDKFMSKSQEERFDIVKKRKLCINCLGISHVWQKCDSNFNCRECNKKHHTLLHRFQKSTLTTANKADCSNQIGNDQRKSIGESNELSDSPPKICRFDKTRSEIDSDPQSSKSFTPYTMIATSTKQVLIATAVIWVYDIDGTRYACRALLDSASHVNFVSESFCQKLSISRRTSPISIAGIGNLKTQPRHSMHLSIQSRYSNYGADLEFLILPKITNNLPVQSFDIDASKLPSNIELADPYFFKSSRIDMLIGAEIYHDIVSGDRVHVLDKYPKFQKTEFGYIVAGTIPTQYTENKKSCSMVCTLDEINNNIQLFWSIEAIDTHPHFSLEEKECERHYAENVFRASSGRYCVALPMKSNINLGESEYSSRLLFLKHEKRLLQNPELYARYSAFMHEYLKLNHMEMVDENDKTITGQKNYYLPHHCVIRESSETTRLRVVFNGSFKTSNNKSLNDVLMTGPKIQQDLFSILIRFRKHIYAFSADVIKMYRQVNIRDVDRNLQRIWWRFNINEELKCYRLCTVTYGTSSAPYLAIRTLKQLAEDEAYNFPKAAKVLTDDFYVDDVATGADTIDDAISLRDELYRLMKTGCFELSKFVSHCPALSSNVYQPSSVELDDNELAHTDSVNKTKSILGVKWNIDEDTFSLTLSNLSDKPTNTKRGILSEITKIFDPIGIGAPVVFIAKCLMQTIWSHSNIQWDDELPQEIIREWVKFRDEIQKFSTIKIPRCVVWNLKPYSIELHGFGDASEKGYGCCIYVVSVKENNERYSKLLCAKSRVAPLKRQTIPRLELCASLLLAELMKKVISSMEISFDKLWFWTDSEVSLYRIKSCSSKYATFVGNRIARIHELSNIDNWYYVPTDQNPADIVSRGMKPSELQNCALWWNGPNFLNNFNEFPTQPPRKNYRVDDEFRKSAITLVHTKNNEQLFLEELCSKYSSVKKLLRIIALCVRFIVNCRLKKNCELSKSCVLYPSDLEDAEKRMIRQIQSTSYKTEINILKEGRVLSKTCKFIKLAPFLDDCKLIRVGGRLANAVIPFHQQHPLLLPSDHHFTKILVRHTHISNLHCGPQALLNIIRNKYWIVNGRNICRKIVHECVQCFRVRPITYEQVMGQLPKERVTPSRPFLTTGIDLCGPFFASQRLRSKITTKVYVVIFVCFCTKACYIDLVHDLSGEAFLAAFRRFCARRGCPSQVFTDNATNFIGTRTQLKELQHIFDIEKSDKLLNFCTDKNITWKTIPPRSPHFGGLWEAAVKNAKYHIKRVIGTHKFTSEELQTIIAEAEACINSRPITPLSTDPNDLRALTPGHFLIGDVLTAPPDPTLVDLNFNRLSRWQKVQYSSQSFWKLWSRDYLNELQYRQKWHFPSKLCEGTMVIIKDNNLPAMKWILGRILKAYPGNDNRIRVVDIKTTSGIFKRSVTQICVLPFEGNRQREDASEQQ